MEMLFELSMKFWYLWLLVIAAGVLEIFMPKIKGAIGEKSVAFLLSGLDKRKYKLINNIMLSVGNKTTQIDHIIVSNYGIFVIETKNYKGWMFYIYWSADTTPLQKLLTKWTSSV
jgi:hypothetical protein